MRVFTSMENTELSLVMAVASAKASPAQTGVETKSCVVSSATICSGMAGAVSSTRFLVCVTVLFQNPADGSCAAHGTFGAACGRRNRQSRAFLKHKRMTVAMNLATIQHHSFMKSAVVDVGVQVGSPLRFHYDLSSAEKSDGASDETSSVIEYLSPAPAVTVAPA